MEKKKFDLYTEEEREQLLMHWWYYYGKIPYSMAEQEKFRGYVKKDSLLMKNIALLSYGFRFSSQLIIQAMRANIFDEMLPVLKETIESDEFKELETLLDDRFMDEIVGSFNNPEPSVSMSANQIIESIKEIVGMNIGDCTVVDITHNFMSEEDKVLTTRNLLDVYSDCLIKDYEVDNDEPTVNFVLGEGVSSVSVFNAERLEKNKEKIIRLIDELSKIEEGVSFIEMCCDKNGSQWTSDCLKIDLLVMLGIATETLQFTLPREDWDTLPDGVPYIIRNKEKENQQVVGNKPFEFKKKVEEFKNKNSKTGK